MTICISCIYEFLETIVIAFFLYKLHYDIIHIFENILASGGEESSGSFGIPSSIFKFGKQENTLKQKLKKNK